MNNGALSPTSAAAAQPNGQTDSGAGAAAGAPQPELDAKNGQIPPGAPTYADKAYKFSVKYPPDFTFRAQPADKLADLKPTPVASFIFLSPTAAASQAPDEPADLEIRVYAAGQATSLESWLTANGLLPADGSVPLKPFQAANASGAEVCSSTMIAPGCAYFVSGGGQVFQLIPASLMGDAMAKTFTLAQ